MDNLKLSARKKRNFEVNNNSPKIKKIRLEDYYTKVTSNNSRVAVNKFHSLLKKMEKQDISLKTLRDINEHVRQLRQTESQENQTMIDLLPKLIQILTGFMKNNFIKDFQFHNRGDFSPNWRSDTEVIFESCRICLFIFSHESILESEEFDVHVNDVIFWMRRKFDEMTVHFSRARDARTVTNKLSVLKTSVIENLELMNDLMKVRHFSSSNVTGLINSCIDIILYHTDSDIQMAALKTVRNFYKKGTEFRTLIPNLTLKSLENLPEHHKFVRNYRIHPTLSVSAFTILIMALIGDLPVLGFYTYQANDDGSIENSKNLLEESLENIMEITVFLSMKFIEKLRTPDRCKIHGVIFNHLVMELIEMSNEAEWPYARFMLNLLAKPLTEILREKPEADNGLRTIAVNALTEIIKKKIDDKKNHGNIVDCLIQRFHDVEFLDYTRKLLIGYLNRNQHVNSNCKLFYGMIWFDDIRRETNVKKKMADLMTLFNELDWTTDEVINNLKREERNAIVYYLDTLRYSHADYHVILKYILCCCYDKNKKFRFFATKCVLDVIRCDIDLMSNGMIAKMVNECFLVCPEKMKETVCSLTDNYLTKYPEKCSEYLPFLLRFLNEQSDNVKKICIDLATKLMTRQETNFTFVNRSVLCCKILALITSDDPVIRNQAAEFCARLWFDHPTQHEAKLIENLDTLVEVANIPNAAMHLRRFLEMKVKTERIELQWRSLIDFILEKFTDNEPTMQYLQLLSVFVTVCPSAFVPHLLLIAAPLNREFYTENGEIEILTAEILNRIVLSETANPDVLAYISLRTELITKLTSPQSLDYSMGMMVSLLKLVNNLSKLDKVYLYENCYEPSSHVLQKHMLSKQTDDNRIITRALCTVICLYPTFAKEADYFFQLLNYYINHPIFVLTTIHCLCYLSIEYKSIMKNKNVAETIRKYLTDRQYPVLVSAVLHNISCSLKNIKNEQLSGYEEDDTETIKAIVETHLKSIIDCAIDVRTQIRETAYRVIKQLFVSGLIPETRLIPAILLMSTDPSDALAQVGIELMTKIRGSKLFDYCRNSSKCILASMKFRLKCLKRDHIRGYANLNGRVEAICNYFYVLHQEEKIMRRHIINSILRVLRPDADTSIAEKLYLADHVALFSYKYQDEIYYVLHQISQEISSATLPDSLPADEDERKGLGEKYYGTMILTIVKEHLVKSYSFNSEKLRNYSRDDGKNDQVRRRSYSAYELPGYMVPGGEMSNKMAEMVYGALSEKKGSGNAPHI